LVVYQFEIHQTTFHGPRQLGCLGHRKSWDRHDESRGQSCSANRACTLWAKLS